MSNSEGRYWRIQQVTSFLGICEGTVWKWTKNGKLPKGIKLSPRVTVWDSTAIKQMMVDKAETTVNN